MVAFYNEIEAYSARYMRNAIDAGQIAKGVVCEASIVDLTTSQINGYNQCHFFAGLGLWSYALRLAGWPDWLPVWTGSCPCQPFSNAGKQKGFADERHLWPHWLRLIRFFRPPIIFGEQVASPKGLEWFDTVQADLERAGYAVGAADLCAASVGAPHIRQRLYFVAVAVADNERLEKFYSLLQRWGSPKSCTETAGSSATSYLAYPPRRGTGEAAKPALRL